MTPGAALTTPNCAPFRTTPDVPSPHTTQPQRRGGPPTLSHIASPPQVLHGEVDGVVGELVRILRIERLAPRHPSHPPVASGIERRLHRIQVIRAVGDRFVRVA